MKGFTVIELILVIALVGILTGVASPFLSSFILRDNWHVATDRVLSQMHKAQSYAMEGKSISGNDTWGVCITGNIYRMFNGSCASPNVKDDYDIPNGVTIGGLTTITFGNLRGEPSAPGTVTITTSLGSSSITLNAVGMIEAN